MGHSSDNKHKAAALQFYHALTEPCPYLANKQEKKFFTKIPEGVDADMLNSLMTASGFRRSHDILYRPVCPACKACIPVRINVPEWTNKTSSEKRIINKNSDLIITDKPAIADADDFALFLSYQNGRHGDSEMAEMTFSDYHLMIAEGGCNTRMLSFRRQEDSQPIAIILYDALTDGASAIYSFFDPEFSKRSLGRFMVYALCDKILQNGGRYLYLGYWIEASQKMAYKAQFSSLEKLENGQWVRLENG